MTLRVVCAWCSKMLVEGDATEPVSHGMCPRCEQILNSTMRPYSRMAARVAKVSRWRRIWDRCAQAVS